MWGVDMVVDESYLAGYIAGIRSANKILISTTTDDIEQISSALDEMANSLEWAIKKKKKAE
jgi:hypothetical protein